MSDRAQINIARMALARARMRAIEEACRRGAGDDFAALGDVASGIVDRLSTQRASEVQVYSVDECLRELAHRMGGEPRPD